MATGKEQPRKSTKSAVAQHRGRMKRKGLVRVEVTVRKADTELVRKVAAALRKSAAGDEERALLRILLSGPNNTGFKEFLASAPFGDIERE